MGVETRTKSKGHGEISAVWMPEGCTLGTTPLAAFRRPPLFCLRTATPVTGSRPPCAFVVARSDLTFAGTATAVTGSRPPCWLLLAHGDSRSREPAAVLAFACARRLP